MYDLGIFMEGSKEVRAKLGVVIRDSDNLLPAFNQIARVFREAESEQFDSLGARGGTEWPPLSTRYRKWKEKRYPGRPILVLSGRTRESLTRRTGDSYFTADSHRMTIGTKVPYARFHQSGTRRMPKRPIIALTKDDVREFGRQIQLHVMKGLSAKERVERRAFL
jgi:phage gpG-like protein